ncbi:hypothetical protein CGCSCA1_v002134 [Colletotrichum siamense]|nr:hypothetical protein CGCSCA1_v002134 [Colletotrichum siamense]
MQAAGKQAHKQTTSTPALSSSPSSSSHSPTLLLGKR